MQDWINVLQCAFYALNQHPIYVVICPIAGIHRFKNQKMEMEVPILTISPSALLAIFLLPVLGDLRTADLDILVLKGRMLPPGDTGMISLKGN